MESKVFKDGCYVWECKSSYTDPGGEIDVGYLKSAIMGVEDRWMLEGRPSGYYYVFPVNFISNTGRRELERFRAAYAGEVDINFYDRVDMQRLIQNLEKLSSMESLVNYIKQVWMEG
ncbi:hypothetical protein H6F67_02375 [Microcoleus sp. FACHB-1515]|uniref:hypothetical protein n=1 Tax=Cyanophyceae TaxID=3028117 RepID=UPI0016867EC4|nr:hypothetical protein [Microcoleus sp. FACHB-1515]MBD2088707.1 hypothetical protein [Microcoleus sp. FACHB-1515]